MGDGIVRPYGVAYRTTKGEAHRTIMATGEKLFNSIDLVSDLANEQVEDYESR